MNPTVVLRTDKLTKRYGPLLAVDKLSLDIVQGELFGFLGPNGAGKTTAINMMCGLLEPDQGRVFIHGRLLSRNGAGSRPLVGVCPQNNILWEKLTCLEQLQFVGEVYGLPRHAARRRGEKLIDDLDLAANRDQLAGRLSGGTQRRLNLALALVHDPEILILDEPEAGLDPHSRVRVRDYIKDLTRVKTIILTTHNMDEADRLADRVAIIDHGRLLVLDTPQTLKQSVGQGDVIEIILTEGHHGPRADHPAYPDLEARLSSLLPGAQVTVGHDTLTVRSLNAVNLIPLIMDDLAAAGLQPGQVRLRPNTLEDVFIRLTGRRLRE